MFVRAQHVKHKCCTHRGVQWSGRVHRPDHRRGAVLPGRHLQQAHSAAVFVRRPRLALEMSWVKKLFVTASPPRGGSRPSGRPSRRTPAPEGKTLPKLMFV